MIKVLSVENMRASDRATIQGGTSGRELMMRAAEGIYDAVSQCGRGRRVLVVCGKGNNAGDGFALALLLAQRNYECTVLRIDDETSEDGNYYLAQCEKIGLSITGVIQDYNEFDIIVDCIFGTGFHGTVGEPYRTVIERINNSNAYVVSADINSGLNGNSGRIDKDSVCVKSDITVSIGDFKPGHFLADSMDVIKKKVNCDIGIAPLETPYCLFEQEDAAEAVGVRRHNSHKGTYGYVALIGGSVRYSGAIRLAAMAQSAMRSGAGVVKLAVPRCICPAVMENVLESTLFPLKDNGENIVFDEEQINELIEGTANVAVGMGIGNNEETYKLVKYLLNNVKGTLIIDADGLNSISRDTDMLKNRRTANVVLTPHPKEFSRLSGIDINVVLSDPCRYAAEFARKYGVIVLLKGNTTVVTDGKDVYLTDRGCAGMATAGSGDVLSGIVTAMTAASENITVSVAAAAYINGLAGEIAQEKRSAVTMVASDTALCVAEAMEMIQKNR